MKRFERKFWKDAANLNLYYANYVLSSSVLIHILAFIFIDLKIVGENYGVSFSLRIVPVIFLSTTLLLIRLKNSFIYEHYKIFFLLSGLLSSFPTIYHASQYLVINESLFSGGMGIILIKVIMVMFVFLPKAYTYTLYILIDTFTIIGYLFLANEIFLAKIEIFVIYMILSNLILIIAYHVNLDLRKKNFLNKLEIAQINSELTNEIDFKERYFNLLAHDLKSPVNLMQSAIGLIKTDNISAERKLDYIHKIDGQLNSLDNLIINVLDWIKTNKGSIDLNPTNINLREEIDSILELNQELIANKKIEVKLQIDNNKLFIDKTSLHIILNNLIRNAIKFSDESESIEIKHLDDLLTVQNTGIPIDDKQLDEFKTSNISYPKNGTAGEKGHGLGLEIVKNLCLINNFQINISKNGKTTIFELKIN